LNNINFSFKEENHTYAAELGNMHFIWENWREYAAADCLVLIQTNAGKTGQVKLRRPRSDSVPSFWSRYKYYNSTQFGCFLPSISEARVWPNVTWTRCMFRSRKSIIYIICVCFSSRFV